MLVVAVMSHSRVVEDAHVLMLPEVPHLNLFIPQHFRQVNSNPVSFRPLCDEARGTMLWQYTLQLLTYSCKGTTEVHVNTRTEQCPSKNLLNCTKPLQQMYHLTAWPRSDRHFSVDDNQRNKNVSLHNGHLVLAQPESLLCLHASIPRHSHRNRQLSLLLFPVCPDWHVLALCSAKPTQNTGSNGTLTGCPYENRVQHVFWKAFVNSLHIIHYSWDIKQHEAHVYDTVPDCLAQCKIGKGKKPLSTNPHAVCCFCVLHTSFITSVMLRTSVATSREAAIMHHRLNSVRYSLSVCPGQCLISTGRAHPWDKERQKQTWQEARTTSNYNKEHDNKR